MNATKAARGYLAAWHHMESTDSPDKKFLPGLVDQARFTLFRAYFEHTIARHPEQIPASLRYEIDSTYEAAQAVLGQHIGDKRLSDEFEAMIN